MQFTTFARTFHEGYEYVDLGLSVKWATCNVGADNPAMLGDYFAFGEVAPKKTYSWSTYKWCTTDSTGKLVALSKYNTQLEMGQADKKYTLDLSDDAARVNWGGDWRMPTSSELYELYENCSWEVYSGGFLVKSLVNGKSIFLPTGGYMNGASVSKLGENGYYWSAGIVGDRPTTASAIYFSLDDYYFSSVSREKGCLVRPVYPK